MKHRIAVLPLLALVAACTAGEGREEALGSEESAIIEGTTSTSDQDAVVLIVLREGTAPKGLCTGTLVAPNLVLTARHCVSETDPSGACTATGRSLTGAKVYSDISPSSLDIYVGVDGIRRAADSKLADGRGKQLVVEEVSSTFCNRDVAFLVLDRPLHSRIAPIRLTGGAKVGENVTAVGWGLTEIGDTPMKRQQRTGVAVLAAGPMTLDSASQYGIGDSEFLVGEAFCSGDSGGPALSKTGAVVGVVSRGGGGQQSSTNAASNCVGQYVTGVYTHLAAKQPLVQRAFGAAGAEPRNESAGIGRADGETCSAASECASGACFDGTCARTCKVDADCKNGDVCTDRDGAKICAPPPEAPPPAPPAEEAPAADPTGGTVTKKTTTTGCSVASPGGSDAGLVVGLGLALAAIGARRRRRS